MSHFSILQTPYRRTSDVKQYEKLTESLEVVNFKHKRCWVSGLFI